MRLRLQPLGQRDTAELIAAILGTTSHFISPLAVEKLHRSTGGNPFFVIEL